MLDLLVLAALCKELDGLLRGGLINAGLVAVCLVSLPFFLGMAPGETSVTGVIRSPIRSLLRTGISAVSLLIYWQLVWITGLAGQLLMLYAFAIFIYLLGRWAGLAWRGLLAVLVMMVIVYLIWQFSGGQ
jgi:hypothetical protein